MKKLLIVSLFFLSACSGEAQFVQPVAVFVCPHFNSWTSDQIKQLGEEDAKLSPDSMLHRAIAEDANVHLEVSSNPSCGGNHAP